MSTAQSRVWEGTVIVNGKTQEGRIVESSGNYEALVRGSHLSGGNVEKEEFASTTEKFPVDAMTPRITDTTLLRRLQDEGIISGYTSKGGAMGAGR